MTTRSSHTVNAILVAISAAQTDHVIYFLITAYVEARSHDGKLRVPGLIAQLASRGARCISRCLNLLLARREAAARTDLVHVQEALVVLTAAKERLDALHSGITGEHSAGRPAPASVTIRQHVYGPNPFIGEP